MKSLLVELDMNYYTYYIDNNINRHWITNYPKEWVEEYKRTNLHLIDPVVRLSQCLNVPKTWSEFINFSKLEQKQVNLFENASQYKIEDGITISVKEGSDNFGIFSLVYSKCSPRNSVKLTKSWIHLLSKIIDTKLRSLINNSDYKKSLSKREIEILIWVAKGKTYKEISIILFLSEHTVREHVRHCIQKMNASSKLGTIMKAISFGLINLNDVMT